MANHLTLPIPQSRGVKLLHITDTHLFTGDGDTLLGINTNASFQAVINTIAASNKYFDLIVATGDFVQDGSIRAYEYFAQKIKQLGMPCVWLAGNHDNYAHMQHVFIQHKLIEYKVVLLGAKWLIVLLHSQVTGKAYGELSEQELIFLDNILNQHSDRYAAVFLHHHPLLSGCRWLDEHCLKNSHQFATVIKRYPNVKSIGFGHIHQQLDKQWHHCRAFSTPSTCVQFEPQCHDFTLAHASPGWREIELGGDGIINSQVHYLKEQLFLPDMSQNGY